MDKSQIERRIREEEDYIRCPKLGNSLERFIARNKADLDDSEIARLLMISKEEVAKIYQECVDELRAEMVDSEDDE